MSTDDLTAVEQALDNFYDAAARLVTETTLRGVLREYRECLHHMEAITPELQAHFELEDFLIAIAVDRAARVLAA